MANYTAADIKEIREATGAGMLDVKKALDEADGDKAKAVVTFCRPDCWGSWNAGKRLVRAGYTAVGDVYEEAGIAHVTMRRPLV